MSFVNKPKNKKEKNEKKQSEPLEKSPATAHARLLLQLFGPNNYGRSHVDTLMQELHDNFGDQEVLSPAAIQYVREYYRKHKDLQHGVKSLVMPFRPSNPIHYENQAELYPGQHPRTEGKRLESLEEAAAEQSFCSFDVIQQTPEALDIQVDQQHVVTEWKPTASNKMPDARWISKVTEDEVRARDDVFVDKKHGVTQIYKFVSEEATICLKQVDVVEVDVNNRVKGINGEISNKAELAAKKNAKSFRRIGTFDQTVSPSNKDYLTPKIDGEAMFIRCLDGKGTGVDRMGNTWEFSGDREIRLLIECVPSIRKPQRVFLTHAWRWGTVNNLGVMFGKNMLEKKKISFDFGNGPVPLEFPSFDFDPTTAPPSDGYVLHKGRQQYFFKTVPTVDIFERTTMRKMEETFGDKLQVDWKSSHGEYGVKWVGDILHLIWLKNRVDKPMENNFMNILEVCNAPPIESWLELFDETGVNWI